MDRHMRFGLLALTAATLNCRADSIAESDVSLDVALTSGAGPLLAVVGTPVSEVPAVRVTREGVPIPGIVVEFTVEPRNNSSGAVAVKKASTDSDGRASCGSWVLDTLAGVNHLRVSVNGVGSTVLAAEGIPASLASIEVVSPDITDQLSRGSVPLSILATDRYGNLVPGAAIDLAVTAGGGTVGATRITTNGVGAAETSWTLGEEFYNEVEISSSGVHRAVASAMNLAANTITWYDAAWIDQTQAEEWAGHVSSSIALDASGRFAMIMSWLCAAGACSQATKGVHHVEGKFVTFEFQSPWQYARFDGTEKGLLDGDYLTFERYEDVFTTSYWVYRKRTAVKGLIRIYVYPFANGCVPSLSDCEPRMPESVVLDQSRTISFTKPGWIEFDNVSEGAHSMQIIRGQYGWNCGFWFNDDWIQKVDFKVENGFAPSMTLRFGCA